MRPPLRPIAANKRAMEYNYDLIVVGGGPGGYVAAIRAAQAGMNVAVVESRQLGGTCLNRGCIPTKILLHSAHLLENAKAGEPFGITAENVTFDAQKMLQRKQNVIAQLQEGIAYLFENSKVRLIHGHGTIIGPHEVQVGDDRISAQHILIAAGSVPARPPIPGLELEGVLTSDELLDAPVDTYRSLVIIGGGVIGVEFATALSAFGCKVTIVEAMPRILPTLDKEISQSISMQLKKRGVEVHAKASVQQIEPCEDGLRCRFVKGTEELSVCADAVLVAIGRRANLSNLFAEDFSVEQRRGIVVNEQFRTSVPSIYAIGDVVDGGIQLAHVASAQGSNAVDHMLGREPQIDLNTVPSCIYTEPEIACVGLTADQAKELGIPVLTGKFNMSGNAKVIIGNEQRSFVKVIAHAETKEILGAQMLSARATDMIGELTAAVVNKLHVEDLAAVIHPHPTYCEGILEAVEDTERRAVHIAR